MFLVLIIGGFIGAALVKGIILWIAADAVDDTIDKLSERRGDRYRDRWRE